MSLSFFPPRITRHIVANIVITPLIETIPFAFVISILKCIRLMNNRLPFHVPFNLVTYKHPALLQNPFLHTLQAEGFYDND